MDCVPLILIDKLLACMRRVPLSNPFFNAPVYYLEETLSTMLDARELMRGSSPSGTIVCAGYQKEGRGRIQSRRWESAPGTNLLFTLALERRDLPFGLTALPLRCGLGLAYTLEEIYGMTVEIKWPNDCLVAGRKIAGILCQGVGEHLFIGMGVNIHAPSDAALRRRAAGLDEYVTEKLDPDALLSALLPQLKLALFAPDWRDEVDRRLYARGAAVRVYPGEADSGRSYTGRIETLDSEGGLVISTEGAGRERLLSGELEFLDSRERPGTAPDEGGAAPSGRALRQDQAPG